MVQWLDFSPVMQGLVGRFPTGGKVGLQSTELMWRPSGHVINYYTRDVGYYKEQARRFDYNSHTSGRT